MIMYKCCMFVWIEYTSRIYSKSNFVMRVGIIYSKLTDPAGVDRARDNSLKYT